MKKILFITFLMLFNIALATTDWNSEAALKRVNTIGTKMLKANNVNYDIEFKVSEEEDVNAYANLDKEIYVYKGLLEFVDNDEELAGVIGHEMGHIVNGHCAKQGVLGTGIAVVANMVTKNETVSAIGTTLAQSKLSRTDEFEADITGVDLMTKAGYNPLAMVSLLNKISGDAYIDILQTHPSGEKRILNAYDYISYNYASKMKNGYNTDSYQKALTMVSPTIKKRNKSERLMKKYKKQQEKLLKKKEKRAKKMQGTNSVWDGYYNTLQYLAS
ncbi:M48 family metallopeptidase [bacterium]|nr:M48 family metallopeptidase [bacterium]